MTRRGALSIPLLLGGLLAAAPARADPLVDWLRRHDEAAVRWLREQLPDDSARCALGVVYVFRDDLTRAALHLQGCAAARLSPGVAGWVRLAVPRLAERLRLSELAPIEVTARPAGLLVEIDTVPAEVFPTPQTIWLPAGAHVLRAGDAAASVTVRARAPAAVRLDALLDPAAGSARLDRRVAVIRANDCTLRRARARTSSCERLPSYDEDDFDSDGYLYLRRVWPAPRHLHGPDPLLMILQTAEEL